MKITAELVPLRDLKPGDLYSAKNQAFWDKVVDAHQLGHFVSVRFKWPLHEAYGNVSTHKITVHQDSEADEEQEGKSEVAPPTKPTKASRRRRPSQ